MASAYACENQCYDSILQILSEEIIPDYYENIFRNDSKFGRNEIKYEAEQRRYHYDVIEKTNGEDGNEDCEINITIAGETFVVQTDKWKRIFLDVVLGNSYHITAPKIYIDDMFNMFEELVQVKYALRGLISIIVNPELERELLAYGCGITVLSPQSLVESIRKHHKAALNP